MIEVLEPPVKAVGLDFDEFLVVSRRIKTKQHIAVAATFGIELTVPEVDAAWGNGLRFVMASYYGHPDPANVTDEEHNIHLAAYNSMSKDYPKQLQPGAREAYDRIVNTSLPLFMVTSLLRDNALEEMDQVGLNPAALFLLDGSDTTPARKPHAAAFDNALAVLRAWNIAPQETLYGGDDLRDAAASEAANMQFLGVPSGIHAAADFAAAGEHGYATVPTIGGFAARVVERAGLS